MDLSRFGFARWPFRPAPCLPAYMATGTHQAALDALATAYAAGDGVTILDGEAGSGKTLVAWKLLEQLGESVTPVVLPAANFHRPTELYQAILFDLGQPYHNLSEHELRLATTELFLTELEANRRVVIVCDEAQNLSAELLEELRMLDNLATRQTKAVFLVLVGLPSLRERVLEHPLGQRISWKPHLEAISVEETAELLRKQMIAAGGKPARAISEEALNLISTMARGNPRRANQLAAASLAIALQAGADSIDTESAYEALTQAGITIDEPEESLRPAYPTDAARTSRQNPPELAIETESPEGVSPKQKARKRRAA